jgi:hypothetical protein
MYLFLLFLTGCSLLPQQTGVGDNGAVKVGATVRNGEATGDNGAVKVGATIRGHDVQINEAPLALSLIVGAVAIVISWLVMRAGGKLMGSLSENTRATEHVASGMTANTQATEHVVAGMQELTDAIRSFRCPALRLHESDGGRAGVREQAGPG